MIKKPQVKLVLALAAMFVLGALSGWGVATFCRPFFAPPRTADLQNHMQIFLPDRLHLPSDQQEKIKPIVADFAGQVEVSHQQSIRHFKDLADAADGKIEQILTPEQKQELDRIRQEREADFQRHGGFPFGHHPGFHGGPPPGGLFDDDGPHHGPPPP